MKEFQLTYSISQGDFIDAHEEHWKSNGIGSRGNLTRGVIGIVAGLIVGYYLGWIGYVLSGAGVILALLPLWRRNRHIRSFEKNKKYGDTIEVTFGEEQIQVKTNDGESKLNWSTYLKVLETKDYLLLYITDQLFSIVPKRAFPDRANDFLEFAKNKISQQSASHNAGKPAS